MNQRTIKSEVRRHLQPGNALHHSQSIDNKINNRGIMADNHIMIMATLQGKDSVVEKNRLRTKNERGSFKVFCKQIRKNNPDHPGFSKERLGF